MNALSFLSAPLQKAFAAAPTDVKNNFRKWCNAMAALQSAEHIGKEAEKWAEKIGVSVKTVLNKRSEWMKRGYEALFDCRHNPALWDTSVESNLPPEAVEHLKKLYDDNKRVDTMAARAFLRQVRKWQNGDLSARIPGFAECPKGNPPKGMSMRNLARYCASKFEKAAMRRGLAFAVGKCGPQTFTTRVNLHYMSHVMLDDVWHDNFVRFRKQGICRVVELDALDAFSGALVFWGCKPRLRRADGTYDTRVRPFVPLCLGGVFGGEGYSPAGSVVMAEHGAAAIEDRIEQILYDASGGLITVDRSGITGEQQAIIGWRGKGKGNSRFKGLLEGHHRIKHDAAAALPGQTGLDREHRPEFTVGILEDDDDLMKAARVLARLHPALAETLQYRLLEFHAQFMPVLMELYGIINGRDWHKMEGWDAIPGNVQTEYRLSPRADAWFSEKDFALLAPQCQEMILAAASSDKRYLNHRRISPAEVQRRERGRLIKLPDHVIAELIGAEFARPDMVVKGAYFNLISDDEISPEPIRYESRVIDVDGVWRQLPDDKYTGVISPFNPGKVFVHDARMRFLGTAMRTERVDRFNAEQLRASYGHAKQRVAELTAPLIRRHAQDIREETKRLKHNAGVLAATPENELARLVAKADPVADQLARAETMREQPDQEERYES